MTVGRVQHLREAEAVAAVMRESFNDVLLFYLHRPGDNAAEDDPCGGWKGKADETSEALISCRISGATHPTLRQSRARQLLADRASAPLFPGAATVGEESVKLNRAVLAGLRADRCFTIDGVDGTLLFVRGEPRWGIIVGQYDRGRLTRAWTLEARRTDGGDWDARVFHAVRGGGVYLQEGSAEPFQRLHPAGEPLLERVDGKPVVCFDPEVFDPRVLKCPTVEELNARAGNRLHYAKDRWSAVSIHADLIESLAGRKPGPAAIVWGPALVWDNVLLQLAIDEFGGHIQTLTGKRFDATRMREGVAAGGDAGTCRQAVAETCRASELATVEPCRAKYLVPNPDYREPPALIGAHREPRGRPGQAPA